MTLLCVSLTWRTWVSFQSPFAVLIDGTLNLRAHVHKLGVVAGIRTRISSLTWNFDCADCILNRITFISVLPLDDNDMTGTPGQIRTANQQILSLPALPISVQGHKYFCEDL